MSNIIIKQVTTKSDLKKFVKFPMNIYKDNKYYVPPLIRDEMEMFSPKKNPAYEVAESKEFLALKVGKIVGRISAILHHTANKKYNEKNLRFGWFDCINDYNVAKKLFDKVEEWGREKGMKTLTGPHGFTDLDQEGMLIKGFEELATIAVYYNYPYYKDLVEKYGFTKDVDYVEYKTKIPDESEIPKKLIKTADWVQKRYNYKLLKLKDKSTIKKRSKELFDLLDEAFEELYGTTPLTEKQKDYYIKKYIPFVNRDLIKIVVNDKDDMLGFLIAMPSLSKAFQKAKGRLFPFGFIHILKGLKTYDILDFYLAGVKKEYRGKGVNLMMVVDILKTAMEYEFTWSESNPELEDNIRVQNNWKYFDNRLHKRRRIYKKQINKT